MNFEFATAGKIVFGNGSLTRLPEFVSGRGRRAALTTGRDVRRAERVCSMLQDAGVETIVFPVPGEPSVSLLERMAEEARERDVRFVVAFGGGSAIDAGKALSALVSNRRNPLDYLEVVGRGLPLENDPVPCIAVPTTAGTGSEVTRNAVLRCEKRHVKVSMRHPKLLPDVALVDPETMRSMPPALTASTGLDALTQLLEAFVSRRSNPLTDALCREGLRRAVHALPAAFENGDDLAAREAMALASLFGGLALANAGLGAVHGFAGPIGGRFSAAHGMICATLLPETTETNLRALRQRAPNHEALGKYALFARIATGRSNAGADDGVEWLRALRTRLRLSKPADWGPRAEDVPELVRQAQRAGSMKGNPLTLRDDELAGILSKAFRLEEA